MTNGIAQPVKKLVAGSVQAAIWKNNIQFSGGGDGVVTAVTLERRYKDREGRWQSSGSFRLNDVPKAILLLTKAYEYMATTPDEDGEAHDAQRAS